MAHKLYPKIQTFFGTTGQLLAGGYLKFYALDTVTPKNVYGEYALTTNNGSQVNLNASGRPDVAIWGSGDYFVEVFNSAGVSQAQDEVREPAALSIPVPSADQFVSGNGTTFSLDTVREVPDPTGHANKQLGTDGTSLIWEAKAALPATDVSGGDDTLTVLTQKILVGTGSAAASSTKTTTATITFATAFAASPKVFIEETGAAPTSSGAFPKHSITNVTATGFTVTFSTTTGGTSADSYSGSNIISAVPFNWLAFGTKV